MKNMKSVKQKIIYFTCVFVNYHWIIDLIDVSIYCYRVKYRAKQKHLLPYHVTNNKFKKFYFNNTP